MILSHLATDHQQVSSVSQSAPSHDDQHQPSDYHHGDHSHTASNPQPAAVFIEDEEDEDQHQLCCQDDNPNVAIFGRAEDTDAFSEVNAGKGESLEIINNLEKEPHDDNPMQEVTESTAVQEEAESTVVQEETESTAIQEESQTGASKPQEWVFSQSGRPAVTNIVTGT